MNPCADHLHQRHINTLWNRPMTHSDAGPFRIPPIILSLSPPPLSLHAHAHRHTHTWTDFLRRITQLMNTHAVLLLTVAALLKQPPLPSLSFHLLLQCKSLLMMMMMMMCCRGNGRRWAAPRAVGGSQPLSGVGGICRVHPSPSFWKEQESDCFWGVGVGELSPLLPAASLGMFVSPPSSLPSFPSSLFFLCLLVLMPHAEKTQLKLWGLLWVGKFSWVLELLF